MLPRRHLLGSAVLAATALWGSALAGTVDRAAAIAGWRRRIEGLLQRGIVPKIDTEYTYAKNIVNDLDYVVHEMDGAGVSQICLAPGDDLSSKVSLDTFLRFPDRFIPTAKDASSREWYRNRDRFARTMEQDLATGDYFLLGEYELRHYPTDLQLQADQLDRDVTVPLDDPAVSRIFTLAASRNVAVQIHYEIEDTLLPPLEALLARHRDTKVIWCHLGQVRYHERAKSYGPAYVSGLIARFPNLHFDLAFGSPWQIYGPSRQRDATLYVYTGQGEGGYLDPAWKQVLVDHPDRFLAASDSDGNRYKSMRAKLDRLDRLILSQLPVPARRAIAFGNAWRLITGETWT